MQEIELKPSRRLGLLLIGMLLLALSAIAQAALPTEAKIALAVGAFALGWRAWISARPRERLRLASEGRLQYYDGGEAWRDVDVRGESFVSPVLIVLRYEAGDEVRTLTLLPDSADAEVLRRLRVSLRWSRRTRSDTASPGAD
jgi:toxin CptA